jgi:O-antigen ligase
MLTVARGHGLRRALIATALVASVLIVQFALFGILQTFAADPFEDGRRTYMHPTLQAAATYSPLGSGLGTFREAYQPFERISPVGAEKVIVNHAHNDYLELWMATGWLVIPCALFLFGSLISAGFFHRSHESKSGRMHRLTAVIALLVPVLHSLFDYPLRTTAHIAVVGLLAGIVGMSTMSEYRRRHSAPSKF